MLDIRFECSSLNYIFVLVSISDSEMLETSRDTFNPMGMNQQSNVTIKNSLKRRKRPNIDTSAQSGSPANPHEYTLFSVRGAAGA